MECLRDGHWRWRQHCSWRCRLHPTRSLRPLPLHALTIRWSHRNADRLHDRQRQQWQLQFQSHRHDRYRRWRHSRRAAQTPARPRGRCLWRHHKLVPFCRKNTLHWNGHSIRPYSSPPAIYSMLFYESSLCTHPCTDRECTIKISLYSYIGKLFGVNGH